MKSHKTVLVVEDELALQEAMQLKLEQAGITVRTASTGEEALKILESYRPDLMMLDIVLPGIDGLEVLRTIRNNPLLYNLPVAIISVSGGSEKIKEAFSLNVVDYFIKSEYKIEEIVAKVKEYLKSSKGAVEKKKTSKRHTKSMRVLVIEDDQATLESVLFKLKHRGFETDFAFDSMSGLHKLFHDGPFLGILLDIRLPGEDGFTFLEKKNDNEKFRDIPVLIFSNLSLPEYITRAVKLNARGYLVKAHHSIEDIVEHVDKCFNKNDCTIDKSYSKD